MNLADKYDSTSLGLQTPPHQLLAAKKVEGVICRNVRSAGDGTQCTLLAYMNMTPGLKALNR